MRCGQNFAATATAKQIAAEVGVSLATVSRILRRLGLNKLSALEPALGSDRKLTLQGPLEACFFCFAACYFPVPPRGRHGR